MTHIFYCAWLKTQVETCVTGTLDMSQAPLRHKWKPGFMCTILHSGPSMVYMDTMSGQCILVVFGDTMDIECTD